MSILFFGLLACSAHTPLDSFPGILWQLPPENSWVEYNVSGGTERLDKGLLRISAIRDAQRDATRMRWLEATIKWTSSEKIKEGDNFAPEIRTLLLVVVPENARDRIVFAEGLVKEAYLWEGVLKTTESLDVDTGLHYLQGALVNVAPVPVTIDRTDSLSIKTEAGEYMCDVWKGIGSHKYPEATVTVRYEIYVSPDVPGGIVKAVWTISDDVQVQDNPSVSREMVLSKVGRDPKPVIEIPKGADNITENKP